MRASRGLKWENKLYKLKRSIKSLFLFFVFFVNALNFHAVEHLCLSRFGFIASSWCVHKIMENAGDVSKVRDFAGSFDIDCNINYNINYNIN